MCPRRFISSGVDRPATGLWSFHFFLFFYVTAELTLTCHNLQQADPLPSILGLASVGKKMKSMPWVAWWSVKPGLFVSQSLLVIEPGRLGLELNK
jgi:hypothetical protein